MRSSDTTSPALIYSLKGIVFCLFLGGCAEHEDEQFNIIPGPFPRLTEVPDRPQVPQNKASVQYFSMLQGKLEQDRALAQEEKNEKMKLSKMPQ